MFVPSIPLASVKAPLRVSVSLARAARQVCEPGLSLSVSCLAPGNYWGRPGTGEDGEGRLIHVRKSNWQLLGWQFNLNVCYQTRQDCWRNTVSHNSLHSYNNLFIYQARESSMVPVGFLAAWFLQKLWFMKSLFWWGKYGGASLHSFYGGKGMLRDAWKDEETTCLPYYPILTKFS